MKLPIQLACWANRFVSNNNLEHVEHMIDIYTDKNDRPLQLEALKHALKSFQSASANGFGHDRIGETLPRINQDGFFLRTTGVWLDNIKPDIVGITEYLQLNTFQMLIVDHVDNLNYSDGKVHLLPARATLCIQSGNMGDNHQTIWRAETGGCAITHPFESEPTYADYIECVGGCEGKLRQDFVLNHDDVTEIVKAFMNNEPVPKRFKSSVPPFCGYHPDLAAEHAEAFGFV